MYFKSNLIKCVNRENLFMVKYSFTSYQEVITLYRNVSWRIKIVLSSRFTIEFFGFDCKNNFILILVQKLWKSGE